MTLRDSLLDWLVVALASAVIVVVGSSVGVWHHSPVAASYRGFDPNLVSTDSTGGASSSGVVEVSRSAIDMTAVPNSAPTVHLFSTDQDFRTSLDVRVVFSQPAGTPLMVSVWNPREDYRLAISFGAAPTNLVKAQFVDRGAVVREQTLGSYVQGDVYRLATDLDRHSQRLDMRFSDLAISDGGSTLGIVSVSPSDAPPLFHRVPIAMSVSSVSQGGIEGSGLTNFTIALPTTADGISKTDDPRAQLVLTVLSLLSVLATAIALFARIKRSRRRPRPSTVHRWTGLSFTARPTTVGLISALGAYTIANVFLFHFGSHTFDMLNAKVFAYVAAVHGPSEVYFLPSIVSPAKAWNGVPYAPVTFPYGPSMALVFTFIGIIYRFFFVDPDGIRMDTTQLEFLIKAFSLGFALADGALIYAIMRRFNLSNRVSIVGALIFLLNPVTWFLVSVWGQTQTVSIFFILLAIWLAEVDLPILAWLALAIAAFSRPQMFIPAVLVGLFFIRHFSLRRNVGAIAWAVVGTFVLFVPLMAATSPAMPVEYLLNVLHSQAPPDAISAQYTYVSLDTYNIWTLVTHFVSGQIGKARMYTPTSDLLPYGWTYGATSAATFVTLTAVVAFGMLGRKAAAPSGAYLLFVAAGTMGMLMVLTGASPHHFLLVIALVILCRKYLSGSWYYGLLSLLVCTSFVATYGSLAVGESVVPSVAPALYFASNPLTGFFLRLYQDDRFMTAAAVANLVVLACLIAFAFRPLKREVAERKSPMPLTQGLAGSAPQSESV